MAGDNLTQHFKYNMTETPGNPSELLLDANRFMDGGLAWGMLGVLWMVVLSTLLSRNYRFLPAALAANVVATFGSFILFLSEFVPGEIPLILSVVTVISVFYSVATQR